MDSEEARPALAKSSQPPGYLCVATPAVNQSQPLTAAPPTRRSPIRVVHTQRAPRPPAPLAESVGPWDPARHSQSPKRPPPAGPQDACLLGVIRVPRPPHCRSCLPISLSLPPLFSYPPAYAIYCFLEPNRFRRRPLSLAGITKELAF